MATWAVVVDSFLFAPLYALGLFLLFMRVNEDAPEHASLARAGMGLITAAFVADEVENLANLSVVRYGWAHPDGTSGSTFHAWTWTLWLAGWAKWVLVITALAVAVVLLWAMFAPALSSGAWSTLRTKLHLLRFQLIVVGLMALVPFGHEQISDLIRRWSAWQLGLTAFLAWIFAIATWLVARRLLIRGQFQPAWGPATRRQIGVILAVLLFVAAAVQTIVDLLTRNDRYGPGWGLLVPAVVIAVLGLIGLFMAAPDNVPPPSGAAIAPLATQPRLPRSLAAFALIAFGLGVMHASFGYSVYAQAWTWHRAGAPLIALGLTVAGAVLARLIGWEPLVGGLAGATAGIFVLHFADSGNVQATVLVGTGLLFVVAGWRLFRALGAVSVVPPAAAISAPVVAAAVALFAAVYVALVALPFDLGEAIGGVGVLLVFVLLLTCAGALVVWLAPGIPIPRALVIVGVKRFPLVLLIVVWFVAASHFDPGGYHNVRLKSTDTPAQGVTLGAAWRCWLAKNGLPDGEKATNACAPGGKRATAGANRPVPLFVLATTGGGIRAAYWTDLVLDCAFEVEPGQACPSGTHGSAFARSDRLFALSGISGGSLGLAEYAAYLAEKRSKPENGWVERALHGDSLSASGAWWLFVEIPRVFLQFRSPTDRAAILERGWERAWPGEQLQNGLLALWHTDHHQPLLLLNGTSVQDGCRFETSPLDANVETRNGIPPGCKSTEPFDEPVDVSPSSVLPATRDLVDFLCRDDKDVRLSTAALLSARFPFVNPSARVVGRCGHANASPPKAYVVDGGYLDTSGASPIGELMTRLQPLVDRWNRNHRTAGGCVVPVMIQIDNGFPPAIRSAGRPGELLVPLTTLFATRGAREAEARVGQASLFSGIGGPGGNRWAHFVNEAHPGPKAPLGWTQSSVSEHELVSQLGAAKNREAFAKVRDWLAGRRLTCVTGA